MGFRWWTTLLIVLTGVACERRSNGGPDTGYSQVVVVTPTGIDGSGRAVPGQMSNEDPFAITVQVQNRSGGAVAVEEVRALVIDSTGKIHRETTLVAGKRLENGTSDTYRGLLEGSRPDESVVGVWTRVRDEQGRPRTSSECRPLCRLCDHTVTQRACEQLAKLAQAQSAAQ